MVAAVAFAIVHRFVSGDMTAMLPSGQALHLIAVAQNGKTWSPNGGRRLNAYISRNCL